MSGAGLDPNRYAPDGSLKPEAAAHAEDFTRNTGAAGAVEDDRPNDAEVPDNPDETIVPSDAPGG